MTPARPSAPVQVPVTDLMPFVLVTFGLAWGTLGLFALLPERMTGMFGELSGHHPLFILAVYAPAIAALLIVAYRGGTGGLRRYLARLLLWRCSAAWYALLLVGIPLLFVAGAALKGNLAAYNYPFGSPSSLAAALALTMAIGPVEEIGWRGLALPLLQQRFAPLWAGLVLGVVWGVWHLPAFLLSGTPQSAWAFTPFLIASTAASVMVTALFNASRGSILLPALFHFQLNNPIWPDAQPYDSLVFVAATLLIVWLNRSAMLHRGGALTQVIPRPRDG